MTRVTDIRKIYLKAKEYFGEDFLEKNDPDNRLSAHWKEVEKFYIQSWKTGKNFIVQNAKDLVTTINFWEIFKSLQPVNHVLELETDGNKITKFHNNIINKLKKSDTFEAYWNLISLPAFLQNRKIKFFPIIEKNQNTTPDYLAEYSGEKIVIECKSTDFNINSEKKIKNNVEKRLKKAKKQLENFSQYPGICLIKTNNASLFQSQKILMELIEKKINRDDINISCILFTYYNDSKFPSAVNLDFCPLLNFRGNTKLPKNFTQEIFDNSGIILISAKAGEKFSFTNINSFCEHYGLDQRLDKFEEKLKETSPNKRLCGSGSF